MGQLPVNRVLDHQEAPFERLLRIIICAQETNKLTIDT